MKFKIMKLACSLILLSLACVTAHGQTLVINGQSGTIITGRRLTSTTGDCVQIINSTNITVQQSDIGPCAGKGIYISGGSGQKIYDNYIHPETLDPTAADKNDGIFAINTANLTEQGNVFGYGESNSYCESCNGADIKGNFFLNPRGPYPRGQQFKTAKGGSGINHNITFEDNYALSAQTGYLYPESQEDAVNFGTTDGVIARNNYITGGHSSSGCGLIADYAANSVQFLSNLVFNTGQCGITIASGTNQLVDSNQTFNHGSIPGGGNTAMAVFTHYSVPCGPVTLSNNYADQIRSDGTHSGYFKGVGCNPTTLTNNVFGAKADAHMTPFPNPPLIPPVPHSCVAKSPYSTQTGTQCP